MTKIEAELKKQINEIWLESLEVVVEVADDHYAPYCSCDPLRDAPHIRQFKIEDAVYTPRELQDAFHKQKPVASVLNKLTLDHICNVFTALGEAARTERPLYTKDRRNYLFNAGFTVPFNGSVQEALLSFFDYQVADREDLLLLHKNNDYENCANRDFVKAVQQMHEHDEEVARLFPQKVASNPERFLHNVERDRLLALEAAKEARQKYLNDDLSVVEWKWNDKFFCFSVTALTYEGTQPAVDHLIELLRVK